MATTCKLNLSIEEEKIQGIYSIKIPYEINHERTIEVLKKTEKGEFKVEKEIKFILPN